LAVKGLATSSWYLIKNLHEGSGSSLAIPKQSLMPMISIQIMLIELLIGYAVGLD